MLSTRAITMNTGQPVGCELFEFSEILILTEQKKPESIE
jgi:hypothetical protein